MKFRLRCLQCGKIHPENKYICRCENGCNSLLRTEYQNKKLEINNKYKNLWKYINWLPVKKVHENLLKKTSSFRTYKSKKLSKHLGLKNLIISLNTYSNMKTGSFKDIEAEVSFQRVLDTKDSGKPFVLSSDGNNAIAFNYYSNILKYPIILFVTEDALNRRIWSFTKNNPYLTLFSTEGDYSDAIELSNRFGRVKGVLSEGGGHNVARRDGVATIMLDVTLLLGHIPDHYFQALGSGPGAIAAYEASLRLIADGRYGKKPPKIHGSQNYPFIPMYDAWKEKSKTINEKYQRESAKKIIDRTYAHVLTNRFPLYSHKGGVYDILKATDGEFYSITNDDIRKAQILFKKFEGCSIVPEAGVTVSSLIKAIKNEHINKNDSILLNITGGGREEISKKRYKIEHSLNLK